MAGPTVHPCWQACFLAWWCTGCLGRLGLAACVACGLLRLTRLAGPHVGSESAESCLVVGAMLGSALHSMWLKGSNEISLAALAL